MALALPSPTLAPITARPARWGATVALGLLLAGCAHLHTPYEARGIAVPAQWSATSAANTENTENSNGSAHASHATAWQRPALQDAWWKRFGDAELDRLITLALQRNSDLHTAAWNIRKAQIALGQSQDRQTPTLGASATANASHNFDTGSTSRNHGVGLSLSYELDLWGKLARQQDAAQWRLAATEQDLQSAAIALVANVAQLYWQLAYQNAQIASGQHSLAYARRAQQLVQARYAAGAASGLERQEARRSVAAQEAALAQLRHNQTATRNALALLLHEPPASATPAAAPPWLPQEPQTLPQHALPDIPAGLPAQVLARRPDVQAAEQRLRATLADGDAARASYYPAISLTGSLNSASRSLGDVLANPIGALGASLALPFLRQQEMRLSNAAARANYEAATLQWQKTLLTALQEVENALSRRTQLAEQRRWLEEQLDAARQAETLNETRYRVGATALKTWLDAQEARRSAELALAANQLSQLENQLTLYKALGGDALLPAPQVPDVPSLMQRP